MSFYPKAFNEKNPNHDKDNEYNLVFLMAQQNYFNDKLHTQGHLFLNEVYDALGFPRTREGSVMGWFGDSTVDLGVKVDENGVIELSFNLDGPVAHLLPIEA